MHRKTLTGLETVVWEFLELDQRNPVLSDYSKVLQSVASYLLQTAVESLACNSSSQKTHQHQRVCSVLQVIDHGQLFSLTWEKKKWPNILRRPTQVKFIRGKHCSASFQLCFQTFLSVIPVGWYLAYLTYFSHATIIHGFVVFL